MDDLIGKRIGGYEIRDLIGHGGMATVYLAHQISMDRLVAVKVLPRQFVHDDTYMQRFIREVKIASTLEHRNIVPVYDYGQYENLPYIIMRYLPGGSVDQLIQAGALSPENCLTIIQQIAPALDYAHSKGVLHRDLKPSNILLDDNGGAYLTDFGIARVVGDLSATITVQGVVGTPSYMSPEQAQGQPLDPRSDLYSLGVTLFEMVTGSRPFEADTPYGTAVLQVTAPPPSPRDFNPELSPAVESVILRALSKKREARYPSAVALAEALKTAFEAPPTTLFDTQPGVPPPELPPDPPPVVSTPPPVQPVSSTPAYPYAVSNPPPISAAPRRPARKRGSPLWLNAAVGASLGCALLVLILIVALLVITNLTTPDMENPTPRIADTAPTEASEESGDEIVRLPTLTPISPEQASDTAATGSVGVRETPTLSAALSASLGGMLVYFAERDGNFDIYSMRLPEREEIRLTTHDAADVYPAVSPDGAQIAFVSDRDGDYDIYVMDIDGGSVRRVTENDVADQLPAWRPDGEWIVFSSDTRGDGSHDLYRVRPDGTGLEELYSNGARNAYPRYSPDGESIAFTSGSPTDASTWEIMRLDLDAGDVVRLTDNAVKDWSPVFLPDGGLLYLVEGEGYGAIARMGADGGDEGIVYDGAGYEWSVMPNPDGTMIVFTSDMSGQDELYIMSFDGQDAAQVTNTGAMYAAWVGAP